MEAKRPSLLLAGAALAALGLLPLLEVLCAVRRAPSADQLRVLLALTPLDKTAVLLGGLLAALGAALLALHWLALSVHAARRLAKMLAAALAVAAAVDAALLAAVAAHRQPDGPWRADMFAEHEGRFERRVNDAFCHAKGLQLCQQGSVAEARQIFPLRDWPVDSARAPGRRIATSCEGFQDSVQLWDYQSKMQLCTLCSNITAEEQQLALTLGGQHSAQVLAAVQMLSLGELQWCGEYLVERRPEHDVGHSPYWKHRREFQALLVDDSPPCSLVLAVRALQLLEVVAVVSCVLLLRWGGAIRSWKMAEYSDVKVDVV